MAFGKLIQTTLPPKHITFLNKWKMLKMMDLKKNVEKFSNFHVFDWKKNINFDNYCQVNINKLKTTGELIREKREKKGLLLRHVSAMLDIDTAILSKIERGERKATRDQITRLAEILEINKELLIVQYLSEKILYELKDEDLGIQALKVAEKTIKYGVTKNK